MSVAAKHAYRFGFLKSEFWDNLRIKRLAKFGGRCHVCGVASLSNDLHHVYYPRNLRESEPFLFPLCRGCHDEIHSRVQLIAKTPGTAFKRFKDCVKQLKRELAGEVDEPVFLGPQIRRCGLCRTDSGVHERDILERYVTENRKGYLPACDGCWAWLCNQSDWPGQGASPNAVWRFWKKKKLTKQANGSIANSIESSVPEI